MTRSCWPTAASRAAASLTSRATGLALATPTESFLAEARVLQAVVRPLAQASYGRLGWQMGIMAWVLLGRKGGRSNKLCRRVKTYQQ